MNREAHHTPCWIYGLALLIMTLSLWGCSSDSGLLNSSAPAESPIADFSYPLITAEMAQGELIPGYRILTGVSLNSRLDAPNCDSLVQSRFMRVNQQGRVGFNQLVSVQIAHGVLPADVQIQVVAPLGQCAAVADFYPHPYQFNGPVEIRWDLSFLDLPSDFDYRTLVPFYVTDGGEYQLMPHTWSEDHRELIVYTDHFSRYIVGQRLL